MEERWSGRALLPIILLETDCRLTCVSLCEVAIRADIPTVTVARETYLMASIATGRGTGVESAVREFPGALERKQGKKKCPAGEDPDRYVDSFFPYLSQRSASQSHLEFSWRLGWV